MEKNREKEKRPPYTGDSGENLTRNSIPSETRFEEVRRKVREEAVKKKEKEGKQKEKTFIQPLRTYKDDIARTIRKKQESFVSVLAAETKRRVQLGQTGDEEKTRTSQFVIAASAILFLAGIGSFGLFFFLSGDRGGPTPLTIPAHVFTEEQREVDITGKNRTGVMRAIIDEENRVSVPLGSIAQIYLTEVISGEKQLVRAADLLSRLEVRAPNSLVRSLEEGMTLGVHVVQGVQPFLILGFNTFELAFSGMLQWEDDIHEDLAPWFGSPTRRGEGGTVVFSVGTPFVDKVIRNRDARVLRDTDGDIVFLYSFLDKETVIITTNETTFNEIVTRFVSSQF